MAIAAALDDRVADMACTAADAAEQVSLLRESRLMKTLSGSRNLLEEASDAYLVRTASSEDGFEGLQDSHAETGEAVAGSLVVVGMEEAGHGCMVRVKRGAAADSG